MSLRVQLVSVPVSDQDRALAFYRDKLDCKVVDDTPFGDKQRWIQLHSPGGGADLVLFTPPGHEDRIGTLAPIAFTSDDVQASYKMLSSRGVEFVEPPSEQPDGGLQALFKDPDGNLFVLHS
jgi:catechol 2,3-dioxygenase-like lactoylglutathione lyase family enzyme